MLGSPFSILPGVPWCPSCVVVPVSCIPCLPFYGSVVIFVWRTFFHRSMDDRCMWLSMPAAALFCPHTWLLVGLCRAFCVDHFPSESCRRWLFCWLVSRVAFGMSRAICSLIIYVLPGLGFTLVFSPHPWYSLQNLLFCSSGSWGFTVRSFGCDLIFIFLCWAFGRPFHSVTDVLQF